jgi:hypothetical protein
VKIIVAITTQRGGIMIAQNNNKKYSEGSVAFEPGKGAWPFFSACAVLFWAIVKSHRAKK